MLCSTCGTELKDGDGNCPVCEKEHENDVVSSDVVSSDVVSPDEEAREEAPVERSERQPSPTTSGKSKNMMKIIIPVGVVALIAIIVGVLFVTGVLSFGKGGEDSPDLAAPAASSLAVPPVSAPAATPAAPSVSASAATPDSTASSEQGGSNFAADYSNSVKIETGMKLAAELPATAVTSGAARPITLPDTEVLGASVVLQGSDSVQIDSITLIGFTPDSSGLWSISASSGSDSGDPCLWLYASFGDFLTGNRITCSDDNDQDNENALIVCELEAGRTYIIEAGFSDNGTPTSDTGGYILFTEPM